MSIEWSGRVVVLIVGPPGAGKTTAARQSGLQIFDRDDEQWAGEKHFNQALAKLGDNRQAQAVIIRWGASTEARQKTIDLIKPTHKFYITATRDECARRIRQRGRADSQQTLSGLNKWFDRFDTTDGITAFPGWTKIADPETALGNLSRAW